MPLRGCSIRGDCGLFLFEPLPFQKVSPILARRRKRPLLLDWTAAVNLAGSSGVGPVFLPIGPDLDRPAGFERIPQVIPPLSVIARFAVLARILLIQGRVVLEMRIFGRPPRRIGTGPPVHPGRSRSHKNHLEATKQ